jgi:Xaa-Pro aminopeptidase
VELIPGTDPIQTLRMVKSAEEIQAVREACQLVDACLEHIVPQVRPGVSENELLLEVELFFRRNGSSMAFPGIVLSGERTARPHGVPSDRLVETGDFVLFDIGCKVRGYCSDITRTFVVGKASERQKEIYAQVLEAQIACVDALQPGANGRNIDGMARSILDEKELAQYFGHGLGHGLGMLVHDSGRLSSTVDQPLEVGQIWTVEPGVYLEGYGGVRIEDDAVITETGREILTHFSKKLMEL